MVDIRGFFGGGVAKPATTSKPVAAEEIPKKEAAAAATSSSKLKKNNVIDSDDEEEVPAKSTSAASTASAASVISAAPDSSAVSAVISTAKAEPKENVVSNKNKTDAKPPAKPTGSTSSSAVSTDAKKTKAPEAAGDIPAELESIITWKKGEKVPYSAVVTAFEVCDSASGRIHKENTLANLFRAVICTTPGDLEDIVYLVSNEVAPAFEGLELGIGDSLLVKAVCQATGRTKDAMDAAYKEEGDLGNVALSSRASQKTLSFAVKPKPLIASTVLEKYRLITQTKGTQAQQRKIEIIKALMVQCIGVEAKYVVRALQGKLRIGTAAQTVLVSLGTRQRQDTAAVSSSLYSSN
eukprot:GSChrysophyteH2.ASY1.ANO1.1316.1 assembled CDS